MKTSSAKAKGRRLQSSICTDLGDFFGLPSGVDQDITSREMGQSGTDIRLSPAARKVIPFDIECKNQERWDIPRFWKQTIENTSNNRVPLLVVAKNRQEPLAVLRWKDLLALLGDRK